MLSQPVITTDPTGRVVIQESDDRDTGFPIVTPPYSVLGIADFSVLAQVPLERARRGVLLITGNVVTNASFTGSFVVLEMNVIGWISGSPTVIMSLALDSNIPVATCEWDVPETYSAVGIEARQNVDGLPSGVTTGITTLAFSLAGTYWR